MKERPAVGARYCSGSDGCIGVAGINDVPPGYEGSAVQLDGRCLIAVEVAAESRTVKVCGSSMSQAARVRVFFSHRRNIT